MILSALDIVKHLRNEVPQSKRFFLAPKPNPDTIEKKGGASIDLRLGTWFLSPRTSRHTVLKINEPAELQLPEAATSVKQFVRLGGKFILHPRSFVLAVTLEWVKLPRTLCGYVTGKSSWGRRGLVIETAPGVHPGFSGCLTLELANVGEIPLELVPGMPICQLFLHRLESELPEDTSSSFSVKRQPSVGHIGLDPFVKKLLDSQTPPASPEA